MRLNTLLGPLKFLPRCLVLGAVGISPRSYALAVTWHDYSDVRVV